MYAELDPRRGPWSRDERNFLIFLAVLAVGFLTADIALSFTAAKLRMVVFALGWVPLLVLRELLRRIVMGRAARVIFGVGRPLIMGRVEWRPLLWSSVALPVDSTRRRISAWMGLVIYPLLLGLVLLQPHSLEFGTWSDDWTVSFWQAIAGLGLLQFLVALIPYRVWTAQGQIPSDGWNIWFGSRPRIQP